MYLHITRILAAGPSGGTLPYTGPDPLFRPFDCLFRLLYFLACPGDAFRQFWGPKCLFSVHFRCVFGALCSSWRTCKNGAPAAAGARSGGFGEVQEPTLFRCFFRVEEKGYPRASFSDLLRFYMNPEGADWAPK